MPKGDDDSKKARGENEPLEETEGGVNSDLLEDAFVEEESPSNRFEEDDSDGVYLKEGDRSEGEEEDGPDIPGEETEMWKL